MFLAWLTRGNDATLVYRKFAHFFAVLDKRSKASMSKIFAKKFDKKGKGYVDGKGFRKGMER